MKTSKEELEGLPEEILIISQNLFKTLKNIPNVSFFITIGNDKSPTYISSGGGNTDKISTMILQSLEDEDMLSRFVSIFTEIMKAKLLMESDTTEEFHA
jgi:hypothetical protein